jgi:hypothetical protein
MSGLCAKCWFRALVLAARESGKPLEQTKPNERVEMGRHFASKSGRLLGTSVRNICNGRYFSLSCRWKRVVKVVQHLIIGTITQPIDVIGWTFPVQFSLSCRPEIFVGRTGHRRKRHEQKKEESCARHFKLLVANVFRTNAHVIAQHPWSERLAPFRSARLELGTICGLTGK